ncbi:MAG TPA: phosphatase PAP2 family protein [Gaiellaceae bacterium]
MLGSIDGDVAVWVATHRVAPLDDFFVALGSVDRLGAIWVACAIVLGVTGRRSVRWTGALVVLTGLAAFAADSISFGVKDLVHRTRPFDAHPEIHPLYVVHSSSFPAGHAATACAGAVLLSYVAPRVSPLFVALALAIGFSRVYVGVHYPSDVLGGAAIGLAVGCCAILALRLVERWTPRSRDSRSLQPA